MNKLFGWVPDKPHRDALVASLPVPVVPQRLIRQATERDVFLWQAKSVAEPRWQRGKQEIGDCVSWGAELVCTCLLWMGAARGESIFEAEAASEAIYGGCRVEGIGERSGGYQDGAAGSWAAQWLKTYGVLLRLDYSQKTGNREHDLREYSGQRAKDWGNFGCGGRNDKGALDAIARQYPVKDIAAVVNTDQAAAAIDAGCPITVASSVGYEGPGGSAAGRRDSEGIIRRSGEWAHQMCVLGKKFTQSGNRLFRLFQSWNDSNTESGPDSPDINDPSVTACSWWITDEDFQSQLDEQDSFAFSHVEGFTQPPYNFDTDLLV